LTRIRDALSTGHLKKLAFNYQMMLLICWRKCCNMIPKKESKWLKFMSIHGL